MLMVNTMLTVILTIYHYNIDPNDDDGGHDDDDDDNDDGKERGGGREDEEGDDDDDDGHDDDHHDIHLWSLLVHLFLANPCLNTWI